MQTCHGSGCTKDLDLRPIRGDSPKGSAFLGWLVEALSWAARQLTSGLNICCGVFPEQDSWILFPIGMGFYGEAQELSARWMSSEHMDMWIYPGLTAVGLGREAEAELCDLEFPQAWLFASVSHTSYIPPHMYTHIPQTTVIVVLLLKCLSEFSLLFFPDSILFF